MGAQVVSFLNWSRPAPITAPVDWSQQELAEFYRVESALIRAGLSIETDRGISDEGDPWFVFLRAEDGEVVVHFARVDGEYLIAGPAYEQVARGSDFNVLVRAMIARHPLVRPQERGSNVLLHPAAILAAIVGTAFFKTGEAKAMENDPRSTPVARKATPSTQKPATPAAAAPQAVEHLYLDTNQAAAILAGAIYAMEQAWDYRARSSASSTTITADAGVIRASLLEGDSTSSESLTFDGLKADAPRMIALDQAPAVLALTAILDSLPSASVAVREAAALSSMPQSPSMPSADGAEQAPRAVLMEIKLQADALPNIQSIQLLRQLANSSGFEKVAVVPVDKIPEALAAVIAHGANFTASPSTVEAPIHIAPVEPIVAAPQPSSEGDPTPPTAQQPETQSTPVTSPPIMAPTPLASSPTNDNYKVMAEKLISYFIAHTLMVDSIVSGKDVVIYDSRVTKHASEIAALDSITFHFNDGSSISLVGEHSMLYHELT